MAHPRVVCLTTGSFQENGFIVADDASRDAVVVDPGEEAELFLTRLETEDLRLNAVWLTHAHLDHILGVATVVERTGVPVHLHPADRPLYDAAANQGVWFGMQVEPPPPPNHELQAGDTLSVGRYRFTVRHVPGHSPGSVAFIGHGIAIVGDALFAGSVGRVDLPGGDGATLLESIRRELMVLPDETIVYSGHGPETTVGRERSSNPFLTGAFPLV
ncbi:MAG: MBL fold metallo-hydrolase [Gemmatimonadota bacterium]|nr:MBL fold metallo-hydrolase [Gemmatimonadota bacterium]MDH3366430.1 MBL fold metallo-hydrolase [Gemmatimonadota bacterium]MDH3478974.1 MBL fold metallo-hydrolase [Gemmatimonadota bacterium]